MNYQSFLPSLALRPYVEAYVLMKSSTGFAQPERIPPGGRSGIVLNLGADYQVELLGVLQKPSRIAIGGQLTQVMWLTESVDYNLLMITFQPTGLYQLFGLPMAELTDQFTSIDDVFSPAFRQQWFSLANQLRELDRDQDRIRLVEIHLLSCANRSPLLYTNWVDMASGWLAQPGGRRVQQLSTELRVSPRQLTREFSRQVGLSPKSFAQVMRFRNVFRAAFSPEPLSWQDLIHAGGWYDQSHFCNDVYRLTGQTPSVFFGQHHAMAEYMIK
ncbi:helix-turn-helix domain-containing protein [Spirosoma validum]|uniref:AraC family transcriptional regulator n=1 Tax=Spirosoma validum TaxID=2771355 RepID=A0A927AYS4_9BACT|nr:helix-turn-helix domain-containing protein [Spirosoma validum]MBD2752344.1 AraC family transcriptional regulator [Spirosoma validum]